MDTMKLKQKVGEHEFDAEGPSDVVLKTFAAWQEMVMSQGSRHAPTPESKAAAITEPSETDLSVLLDKISKLDGRVVSLTARGASVEDEILLVLFGQKVLRDNDSVTGSEIIHGLRLTGRTIIRVDYQLDKLTENGDVITIGQGRARRYRLTNQGFSKAGQLAAAMRNTIP